MKACWNRRIMSGVLLLGLAGGTASARPPEQVGVLGTAPVSWATLSRLRGGFSIGDASTGFELSFAIKRVSYINGELVAQNALALPSGAAVQGSDPSTSMPSVQLIQNGPGNTFSLAGAGLPPGALTVIQNTLDNQVLKNATIIDATVTTRRFVESMAVTGAVDQALARAMR